MAVSTKMAVVWLITLLHQSTQHYSPEGSHLQIASCCQFVFFIIIIMYLLSFSIHHTTYFIETLLFHIVLTCKTK
jgi:hypothetical protein